MKPSNLMLEVPPDGGPRVKVLDFGLAQLTRNGDAGGELTISSELLGTVDYVAPEQVANPRTVDERADLYGLGATLYRLLSGRAPHHGTDSQDSLFTKLNRISKEPCPSIATGRPGLPPSLVAVVDRLTARDPADRFSTAGEVAEVLAPFAEGHRIAALLDRVPREVPAGPPERVLSSRRPVRTRGLRLALALMAIALPAGLFAVWKPGWRVGSGSTASPPAKPSTALVCPRGITLGADGALYGGAIHGGLHGFGALYRYTPRGGVEILAHFTGTNGPVLGRMAGRQLLLARDGQFYGVTERGGRHDQGTLFRMDPASNPVQLTTLWEFDGTDGGEPMAGLIEDCQEPGLFHGGTQMGGQGGSGTLFRLDCRGGTARLETRVHFTGDQGVAPGRRLVSALAQTADGNLYGTTPEGGAGDGGTAFRLSPEGQFTSLVAFGKPPYPFFNPTGGITLGRDGNLYGHCHMERDGNGTLFRLTPGGELKGLVRFGPPGGIQPASTLLCAPDGALYGTTLLGGAKNRGTLFKVTPDGTLTTLASFPDVGGPTTGGPWGLPTLGPDGNLYGTIEVGGPGQNGLLYRVTPRGELVMLVEFARTGTAQK